MGIVLLNNKRSITYRNRFAEKIGDREIEKIIKHGEGVHKIGKKYYRIREIESEEKKIMTIEDVTEKVMAENALKESEDKYRMLSENSFMGIMILKKNRINYVNRKMEEILGYKGETLKKKFFDLIHPEDSHLFEEVIKGNAKQIRFFDKNGNLRWLEMVCKEIPYGGKSYMFNILDVTKRKEMEDKIKDVNKKMKRVLEKERKFLEEVSHYFFNPLCIAKGYLELSIPNADPALRKKLETTKQAVIRVENVVKHIVMEGKIYE